MTQNTSLDLEVYKMISYTGLFPVELQQHICGVLSQLCTKRKTGRHTDFCQFGLEGSLGRSLRLKLAVAVYQLFLQVKILLLCNLEKKKRTMRERL